MQKFLTNVGPADEIRGQVLSALGTDGRLSLVLDEFRTLMLRNVRMFESRMVVICRDVNDNATVMLILPYGLHPRGRAEITKFESEED